MNRPISTSGDRDDRLAQVLAALTNALQSGRPVDLEGAALEHPDLAEEVRELWSAALLADQLAREALAEVPTEPDPDVTVDRRDDGWSTVAEGPRPSSSRPTPAPRSLGRSSEIELLEELGRGGMGVVYRGFDRRLGREVAVKRLLRGDSASDTELARFRLEARAGAGPLRHPNVVTVYEEVEHGDEPYLVMEYVPGTTLAKRLAAGPLPARDAARLLAPVARAIEYIHGQGVLHRDLKPSNILIDPDGRPLVSDFGLAKHAGAAESLTQSGAVIGTPSYMAPEQAAAGRGPVDRASDVYGLGAILYHMLTGRPPFQAATALETILLLLETEPVPPRALNPKASSDLEMIAMKCLMKDSSLRYPTAAALAADLEAFLAGEPISARSASLKALAGRLLGETHLAPIVENWGVLWMMHSAALLVFLGATQWLALRGVSERWPYFLIFTAGLGVWASFFWWLRRRGGPISFTERLLAHVWGAGVISINLTFALEWLMGLPVLTLAPVMAITNGMLFLIKGGILSGTFYFEAAVTFLTLVPMALWPRYAPIIFGVVASACFFVTGLQAQIRRARSEHMKLS